MKRFASLLLVLIFIFSITACKKNNSDNNSSLPDNTTSGFISLDIEDDESADNATGDENTEDKNDTSSKDSTTSDADKSDNSSNKNNSFGNDSNESDSSGGYETNNSKDGSDTVSGDNSSTTSNNNSAKPSDTDLNNNSTDNTKDNAGGNSNSDSNDGAINGAGNNSNNTNGNSGNSSDKNSDNNSSNNSNTAEGNSQNNTKPENSDNSSETTTSPDSSNPQGGDSNNPNFENGAEYKNIECRSVSNWKTVEIALNSNKLNIKLSVPSDWVITENGKITVNNSEIGSINTTLTENFIETYEKTNVSGNISDVSFEKSIRKTSNGINIFKRVFKIFKVVNSDTKQIFITVNYSELDDSATAKIFNSISYFGVYRSMPEIKNTSKPILILVNDFIKNSKIDEFLTEMISSGKKNYSVETMNISSIANNSSLIDKINSGEYSMIFQCGLSKVSDDTLNKIIDKCNYSNTGFILFPAYSESESAINNFLNKYTDIYCINWKNEIEQLKNSGLGDGKHSNLVESDFYNSSQYSTPLAGYVGAHMIYRNLFNTIPEPSTALLTDSEFKKLVNYPTYGLIPGQSKIEKYLIK